MHTMALCQQLLSLSLHTAYPLPFSLCSSTFKSLPLILSLSLSTISYRISPSSLHFSVLTLAYFIVKIGQKNDNTFQIGVFLQLKLLYIQQDTRHLTPGPSVGYDNTSHSQAFQLAPPTETLGSGYECVAVCVLSSALCLQTVKCVCRRLGRQEDSFFLFPSQAFTCQSFSLCGPSSLQKQRRQAAISMGRSTAAFMATYITLHYITGEACHGLSAEIIRRITRRQETTGLIRAKQDHHAMGKADKQTHSKQV